MNFDQVLRSGDESQVSRDRNFSRFLEDSIHLRKLTQIRSPLPHSNETEVGRSLDFARFLQESKRLSDLSQNSLLETLIKSSTSERSNSQSDGSDVSESGDEFDDDSIELNQNDLETNLLTELLEIEEPTEEQLSKKNELIRKKVFKGLVGMYLKVMKGWINDAIRDFPENAIYTTIKVQDSYKIRYAFLNKNYNVQLHELHYGRVVDGDYESRNTSIFEGGVRPFENIQQLYHKKKYDPYYIVDTTNSGMRTIYIQIWKCPPSKKIYRQNLWHRMNRIAGLSGSRPNTYTLQEVDVTLESLTSPRSSPRRESWPRGKHVGEPTETRRSLFSPPEEVEEEKVTSNKDMVLRNSTDTITGILG